jgi:hypothetical protein
VSLPEYRLMDAEATVRGFPSAKALARWCKRRDVPYRRDGGLNWIRPGDVDAAISRLPEGPSSSASDMEDRMIEAALDRAFSSR